MASVGFNRMPTNLRVPGFRAEVNSGVSYFAGNSKLLLLGQMLSSGTATANVPTQIQLNNIATLFGAGSMLVDMILNAALNNPLGEFWALPLADPSGSKAAGAITVSGTLTPGVAIVYICGIQIAVSVGSTDTPTTIATALAAAINAGYVNLQGASLKFPVVATSSLGVVTITANHVGVLGNNIELDNNLIGNEGPNAANIAITPMTSGTGIPTLTSGLAALGAAPFDMIACPWADTTTLNALQSFLADSGGRWDPMFDIYGTAFCVQFGTQSALTTLGTARNDDNVSIMGVLSSPTPPWVWASAIGAQAQLHKNLGATLTNAVEISRPMQTLQLLGVLPPASKANYWTDQERQTLYYDGISAFTVAPGGGVAIDRLITTYQLNAWGSPDTTWLDIDTRYQVAYALRYIKQQFTATYPRSALAADNPAANQGVATPTDVKASFIHWYTSLCQAGVMQNPTQFAGAIIVNWDADPNRLDAYLPFQPVNQLRVMAVNATTFLNPQGL
jgi:phage tail sheath gpL-like